MQQAEVSKIAKSAWEITERGDNRFGRHGGYAPLELVQCLAPVNPDALALYITLRAHNGPDSVFPIANAMANSTIGPWLCKNSRRYDRPEFWALRSCGEQKRKNLSSARHCDQIRFCFHTTKTLNSRLLKSTASLFSVVCLQTRNLALSGRYRQVIWRRDQYDQPTTREGKVTKPTYIAVTMLYGALSPLSPALADNADEVRTQPSRSSRLPAPDQPRARSSCVGRQQYASKSSRGFCSKQRSSRGCSVRAPG